MREASGKSDSSIYVTGICEETCKMEKNSEECEQNIICFTNKLFLNLWHTTITSFALYYYLRITNLYKLHQKKNDHIILIIQHASEHTGWQDEHKYEPLFLSY